MRAEVDARDAKGVQVGDGNTQNNFFSGQEPVEWPVRVGIVPQPAASFQGRSTADELHTSPAAGAGTRLLSGLGGVGKTQLAIHLAERLWSGNQIDLLLWVAAGSRQSIITGYAQAAADLALRGVTGADIEQDAARFHAWLASTDRRWLVVLDDLTATADLQQLWPPGRRSGRTVVTTRLRGAGLDGPERRLIAVGTFSHEEAVHYLRARLGDTRLADDPAGVAADLGRLPLALAQAAAFLRDERVTCSEYRRRFADSRARLDDLVPDPSGSTGLPDDYQRTVAATLALSIDAADATRPAGLARPLLELASVLDPAGIPTSVFTTTAAGNWLSYRCGRTSPLVDERTVRSGLQVLHRLNLITATAETVTVHALVQRATRDTCTQDTLADTAWAAADALTEIWPDVERDTAHAQRLRSNTTTVRHHAGDSLVQPSPHPVVNQVNRSLGESGNPAAAMKAFEQLRDDLLRVLGPDHLDTLTTRSNLAHWRGEAGDAAGAASAFHQLLNDLLRVVGPDHRHTLTIRNNLAHWRGKAGDPAGAATAAEELLEDQLRVLGPDHPDTLATRGNLAHWRGEAGDAAGAATATEELLDDQLWVLGPDHPATLHTRKNLASWRGWTGDTAGAVAAFRHLLEDQLRVQGPDHPDTLDTRSNLATWRGRAGDPAGAATATEELLGDQLRVLGPDHPGTLATRGNLATWRGEAGDPAGAATATEELLGDQLRVQGPDHPDTLVTRSNLATWRGRAGDAVGAATAFQQLLNDQMRVLGPDHPGPLNTLDNLDCWRGQAGEDSDHTR
ncbi:FxSxx-COOH system tetratricopeptide repeat protein [Actinoplanes sp. NPDC048796]|uniref:FxSxx-COOH system tetratricopeptide repeat protein n=1 Tax=Actinoplanes sp. NPDC048796 TaxID=3155640 RepID=UPI00340DF2DC